MRVTLLAAALATVLVAAPAVAQGGPGGGPQQMAARQQTFADSAVKHLGLDAELGQKVHAAIMGELDKRQAAMQGSGGDREAMMARMQTIQTETETELAKLLTEAQMAGYRELRTAMLPRGGRRPGGN